MYMSPYIHLTGTAFNLNYGTKRPLPRNKDIELKPLKKKIEFAERIDIVALKNVKIQTNFNNKPRLKRKASISNYKNKCGADIKSALSTQAMSQEKVEPMVKWKTNTISIQLKNKGIAEINRVKPSFFSLNFQPKITLNDICNTLKYFLEQTANTNVQIYDVLDSFRKVFLDAKLSNSTMIDKIKDNFKNELHATREEVLDLDDFKYFLSQEKLDNPSPLTHSKQYYPAYLAFQKNQWKDKEEKTFICPLINPYLLKLYLLAIDDLFNDVHFENVLNRSLTEQTN